MTTYTYGNTSKPSEALLLLVNEEQLQQLKQGTPIVGNALDQHILSLFDKEQFRAKANQVAVIATLGLMDENYLLLAGYNEEDGINGLRELFAAIAKQVKSLKLATLSLSLNKEHLASQLATQGTHQSVQAMIEGLQLALYERTIMKKEAQKFYNLQALNFVLNESQLANIATYEAAVTEAEHMIQSVKLARDLTNMSGNELTPERLAFYAEELANELELDIEVLDEWSLAEEQMGALLGVGQGSINPPRMIVIHYEGDPSSDEKWGLVGKGITFDTGGISLKPAANMEDMISDMGGAAAVLGAIRAIASMKLPVNVVVVVPTAENMPSDRALKPGDVITTMSGHTVEIINTDAEGRLVLADGMTTAIKRGATKLIDVATLTGAVLVALGTEATGAITNNEQLMQQVIAASAKSGERVWQLPAYAEYKKLIRSDVADLKNTGGRHGGTITGGLFVGHFAEDKPWVHLDIAGTAFLNSSRKWEPKGATGVMVRTIYQLISEKD
ncbi:leucyl aminopeptidase [Paenibacillus endoradicis]|uniref:leucyl aminopeptidase n=1 Tax=Paenibacillus endoradicis TaxID=2972487 RepID=UPI002158DC8A|nr:leucyl aminopeptidase [Paenibacillus endoradicis]MCR8657902.1 leucyl aminopeptidase [Paenibacillus endoradicis]